MTEAQIRYFQLEETKRHNTAQEQNWTESLQETKRHNLQGEALSRYATDVQKWATQVNAQTSRYVADTNAAASRYSADRHYQATVYSADRSYQASVYATQVNAATQRYVSDQNARVQQAVANLNAQVSRYATETQAATQRYVSDQSAATQRYSTDVNAATSVYRTDVESADRQARLAFDRQTQLVKNALESKKVQLEALRTAQNNAESRARVQKMASDVRNAAAQLELNARTVGMQEEAQKYQNILTQARSIESGTKSVQNITSAANDIIKIIVALMAL